MTFPRSCRGKRSRPPLPSSRQRFSFPSAPRNGVFAAFSFVTCIVDTMCYHQSAHIEFSAGGSPPGAPTPGVQRHCAPRRTWGVFFTSPLPPTSRQLRHPCWRTSGAPALALALGLGSAEECRCFRGLAYRPGLLAGDPIGRRPSAHELVRPLPAAVSKGFNAPGRVLADHFRAHRVISLAGIRDVAA